MERIFAHITSTVILPLALLIAGCTPPEPPLPAPGTKPGVIGAVAHATMEELGWMNREFANALMAGDAAAAAAVYDENASLLPPGEGIVSGRANIQHYWQGAMDAGIIEVQVNTIDAKSDGDLGYEIGTFVMKLKGEKGDTIVDTGKYTEILRHTSDDKWISTYGMWNSTRTE